MERFEVTWEADDGYCGGSAPHRFRICEDEVEGLDERDLRKLFWERVQEDFEQRVNPVSQDEDKFIAWAKERQSAMGEEG